GGEVLSDSQDAGYVFNVVFTESKTCRVNQAVVLPTLSLLLKV
ncbi:MAG: hypothetical protein K940chlam9_01175, partial [Chlamydiae bacterium]|nr:hypothetical protein [Chlamydiota bacterium]